MEGYSSVVNFGILASTHDNFIRVTLTQANYIINTFINLLFVYSLQLYSQLYKKQKK